MEKTTFTATVYSEKPIRELTNEEGIELSDLLEAFYKSIDASVSDVAIDDVSL